jgi:hypothetical protein
MIVDAVPRFNRADRRVSRLPTATFGRGSFILCPHEIRSQPMAKPKKPGPRSRSGAQPAVRVEFDYAEASLLVVATNVLFGGAAGRDGPDAETTRTLKSLMNKLYAAEPRLKADARRIEKEMRDFLIDETEDLDGDEDEEDAAADMGPLKGANLLPVILAAMEADRAIPLLRRDGVIDLFPTGAGQIGDVGVAIGWSAAHGDYTLVRMDEVIGIGLDNPRTRPTATDPSAATLARLCPKPPTGGSLL